MQLDVVQISRRASALPQYSMHPPAPPVPSLCMDVYAQEVALRVFSKVRGERVVAALNTALMAYARRTFGGKVRRVLVFSHTALHHPCLEIVATHFVRVSG